MRLKPKSEPETASPRGDRVPKVIIDWDAARLDYETTDVGWRALAARYGIKSDNTLRRRATAEGWRRDHLAISAAIVTEAVAILKRTPPTPQPSPEAMRAVVEAEAPRRAPRRDGKPRQQRPMDIAQPFVPPLLVLNPNVHTPVTGSEALLSAAPDIPAEVEISDGDSEVRPAPDAQADVHTEPADPVPDVQEAQSPACVHASDDRAAEDRRGLDQMQTLASQHAAASAEQIRQADLLGEIGELVGGVLASYMRARTIEDRNVAANILLLGDKDSLAGTLNALGTLMEKAAGMKRRALGMDTPPATTPGSGDAGEARDPETVRSFLREMPVDALFALRAATLAITRTRPAVATVTQDGIPAE